MYFRQNGKVVRPQHEQKENFNKYDQRPKTRPNPPSPPKSFAKPPMAPPFRSREGFTIRENFGSGSCPKWLWIVLIVVAVLLALALGFLAFRSYSKKGTESSSTRSASGQQWGFRFY
jgi:hypothetical protein